MSEMSRYQLGTFDLRAPSFAMAFSEKDSGASPGGQDRHFWVPLYRASIPQSSMRTSMPPRLVTVSTR